MTRRFGPALLGALSLVLAAPLSAKEMPIGKKTVQNGLDVSAVYLQPIEMEPAGMMKPAADSDIHLEADIKAAENNKNGFAEGDWVPALQVHFQLARLDGGKTVSGELMPMVANDGPHYGDNVKLDGPGRYRLTLTVAPPGPNAHFGRHVDKETGVAPWFKPFDVVQEFAFAGTGKKGAY